LIARSRIQQPPSSDGCHVEAGDGAVEVATDHLLAVPCHDALTRSEVLRGEDGGGDNQRNVGSVDVAGLEVASTLEADEDLVPGEVRILVDREAVADCTDWGGAHCEWVANLTLAIDRDVWLVEH